MFKAAELLQDKYRYEINAATMLGQVCVCVYGGVRNTPSRPPPPPKARFFRCKRAGALTPYAALEFYICHQTAFPGIFSAYAYAHGQVLL